MLSLASEKAYNHGAGILSAERPGTVERAFELARAGKHTDLAEIVAALKRERHDSVEAHLAGPSIRRELRRVLQASA